MPNIKMKKGEYKDSNAIYDVMNYCLNHDLRDYNVMYLPVRNDYMMCAVEDRAEEVKYMENFWNAFLDVYNENHGKRFNHFIIGIGYENEVNVHCYADMIPGLLYWLTKCTAEFMLLYFHSVLGLKMCSHIPFLSHQTVESFH